MSAVIKIPDDIKADCNILLAEDNLMNQKLLSFMIKSLGLNCTACNNGKEAVEVLRNQKFDLVLMDVEMPEMNGYQATKFIREELKMNMPVIAATAYETEEDIQKCIDAGMNDHLQKPIKENELLQKLSKYLFPEN
jgi:CheY-like chemotaxis protein